MAWRLLVVLALAWWAAPAHAATSVIILPIQPKGAQVSQDMCDVLTSALVVEASKAPAYRVVAFNQAVNVTLGLPIIRTSPSHGTAFDIAGSGTADASGMIAAMVTALRLIDCRETTDA